MELSSIQHIEPENLSDIQSDLFIASLSYESRCTTIARRLECNSCRKVALSRKDQSKEYEYEDNLLYFQENGFEIIEVSGDKPRIENLLTESRSEELKIIMDCTSMPQHWYYEIFSWFANNDHLPSACLRMVYTMAAYVEEGTPPKVKKVREFLVEKTKTKKPKRALILGLGQEPNVSEMICKIVKPDLLYLFYADPPVEKRFVEKVFVNNHEVINATHIRNLISYPISNGQTIYQSLIDVILPLRSEYSITLIPQGPKIFSIAAMLLQMGYPDMVVSYPVFKKSQLRDRIPCGRPVVLDVLFEGEE
jgi:hypothetical protein